MRQAQNAPAVQRKDSDFYSMDERLELEERKKPLIQLLFMCFKIRDISSSLEERKSGTDFLLYPANDDGTFGAAIRAENKFEQYLTGNLTLEVISVDRQTYKNGGIVPGWLFTSQAAWLFSYFPNGELVVLRMDEVRDLVLPNLARHKTTTARNKSYLSWSALEDINYLLQAMPSARWVDLTYETGQEFQGRKLIRGPARDKKCSVEELVEHMRLFPGSSKPRPVTQDELMAYAREMAPKNLKLEAHKLSLERLRWLTQSPPGIQDLCGLRAAFPFLPINTPIQAGFSPFAAHGL